MFFIIFENTILGEYNDFIEAIEIAKELAQQNTDCKIEISHENTVIFSKIVYSQILLTA